MKTSKTGIDLIKKWESFRPEAYLCPANVWTIGYGHTAGVKEGDKITEEEATELLYRDLVIYERIVNNNLRIEVNQNQFDSLVSYTYNTGGSETLWSLINNKANKDLIYSWFAEHYITANGIKLKGLVARRKEEAELYFKEL